MALSCLNAFVTFVWQNFLEGKRFLYVKALPWIDDGKELGSKVVTQIIEDKTQYPKPGVSNFGEQLSVKVRNVPPAAFGQFKPLNTEVVIQNVEKATVYGEYRNQLSIIASIAAKEK